MPCPCSANSAQYFSLVKPSSIMWNRARKTALASAVFSSRSRSLCKLRALGWSKTKTIIEPTLITWSRSSSTGNSGKSVRGTRPFAVCTTVLSTSTLRSSFLTAPSSLPSEFFMTLVTISRLVQAARMTKLKSSTNSSQRGPALRQRIGLAT